SDDGRLVLTVAPTPQFDLSGPVSVKLKTSGLTDVRLSVQWLAAAAAKSDLRLTVARAPEGVRVDHIEVGGDSAHVFLETVGSPAASPASLSVAGSIETESGLYRKAARDIELIFPKKAAEDSKGAP